MTQTTTGISVPGPDTAHPREVIEFIHIHDASVVRQVHEQLIGLGIDIPEPLNNVFVSKIKNLYIVKKDWLWSTSAIDYQKANAELHTFNQSVSFELAGVHIPRNRKALEECIVYEEIKLIPEPKNKFDPNAIQVTSAAGTLGHVAASDCASILDCMKFRHRAFIDLFLEIDGYLDVYGQLYYHDPADEYPLNEFYSPETSSLPENGHGKV
ncbi:MAG: hypothetical protein H6592_13310 [Flavobacteriales bacterium]|nr:hypothetical protein [Flavobacteriales bacterium]HPF91991.1 hypothetical protein [Flavobacteriales bacterium]